MLQQEVEVKVILAQLVACSFLHISYLSSDLHSKTLKFHVALLLVVHEIMMCDHVYTTEGFVCTGC